MSTVAAQSPSRAVLDAFASGAPSLASVASQTGLPIDLVTLMVAELTRLGFIRREVLSSGCPSGGGCGGCESASPSGEACSSSSNRERGPVLLTLSPSMGRAVSPRSLPQV